MNSEDSVLLKKWDRKNILNIRDKGTRARSIHFKHVSHHDLSSSLRDFVSRLTLLRHYLLNIRKLGPIDRFSRFGTTNRSDVCIARMGRRAGKRRPHCFSSTPCTRCAAFWECRSRGTSSSKNFHVTYVNAKFLSLLRKDKFFPLKCLNK